MTTERELREKLRKIAALFEGATTAGERDAAAAATQRIRAALNAAEQKDHPIEVQFRLSDVWHRRLFTALCRRYGLQPYRYPRQRYSTVVVRAPKSFINITLWPEFLQIKDALYEYLNEATERIIREDVFRNSDEAEERPGSSSDASSALSVQLQD
jgi:hypothetical protein